MKREIEKKYEFTVHDYEIIKDKCEFVEEKDIKDYYLDMPDFRLAKEQNYLRIRNGMYEYKDEVYDSITHMARAIEYDDEAEINKQLEVLQKN